MSYAPAMSHVVVCVSVRIRICHAIYERRTGVRGEDGGEWIERKKVQLTFFMSFIFVNCLPNSHRSTPNFRAQFRTLQKTKIEREKKTVRQVWAREWAEGWTNVRKQQQQNGQKRHRKLNKILFNLHFIHFFDEIRFFLVNSLRLCRVYRSNVRK